jgi:3-deoxy-7-phosphoheptulonate synthase
MILLFHSYVHEKHDDFLQTMAYLRNLPNISLEIHIIEGKTLKVIELYLIGDTQGLSKENLAALPGVASVVQVSSDYKKMSSQIGSPINFEYQGVTFSQDTFHVFAGLCAVDNRESVEAVMKALQAAGQICTRMGAYKPRTSPYAFQGLGKDCLSYVFELAHKYGIRIIAMEVTHEKHIEEIHSCLEKMGNPTGVMLQIGTRNAQNFELLKAVGQQTTYPILYKRGYGISLHESLCATEYIADSGNQNIIFCLRGVKSIFSAPHRNLVDFAQVPVVKRLTRMPVCIDPSHSVGNREHDASGISDVFHATAQGIISGANMVLADVHSSPPEALVDGRQAIALKDLGWYLEDIQLVRNTYQQRIALAKAKL